MFVLPPVIKGATNIQIGQCEYRPWIGTGYSLSFSMYVFPLVIKGATNIQIGQCKYRPWIGTGYSLSFKVVDSCWTFSTELSDTFRSCFVYGKEQES